MSGYDRTDLAIDDLVPDWSNPRLPTMAPDDVTATLAVIRSERKKFIPLLEDIARRGLNPTESLLVTRRDDGKYTVLEGNRRIAALHVLSRPGALDEEFNEKELARIAKARSAWAGDLVVHCAIMSPQSAAHWIEGRHTGERSGAGLVPWDSVQVARWEVRKGKKRFDLEMYDFVLALGQLSEDAREAEFPLSTLKRLLSDGDFREKLGVELTGGGLYSDLPVAELAKPWVHLVERLATKKLKVTDVDASEDRKKVLQELPDEVRPDLRSERTARRRLKDARPSDISHPVLRPPAPAAPLTPPAQSTPPPSGTLAPGERPEGALAPTASPPVSGPSAEPPATGAGAPPDTPRAPATSVEGELREGEPVLAGLPPTPPRAQAPEGHFRKSPARRLRIVFTHARLYEIYEELSRPAAASFPNAASVLLRTFVEGTLDKYEAANHGFDHRVKFPEHLNGKRPAGKAFEALKLHQKLWLVAEHLRCEGVLTKHEADAVKMLCDGNFEHGSVFSLHAFVHNIDLHPTAADVRNAWDRLERVIVAALARLKGP